MLQSWKTLVWHFLVERLHIVCVLLFTLKISNQTTNSSDWFFLFFFFSFLCVLLHLLLTLFAQTKQTRSGILVYHWEDTHKLQNILSNQLLPGLECLGIGSFQTFKDMVRFITIVFYCSLAPFNRGLGGVVTQTTFYKLFQSVSGMMSPSVDRRLKLQP